MSRLATVLVAIGVSFIVVLPPLIDLSRRIDHLENRVDCLEHPHAESSVAGHFVGTGKKRHFVITQPAHRTGCK